MSDAESAGPAIARRPAAKKAGSKRSPALPRSSRTLRGGGGKSAAGPLQIVMVASEARPFATTGGLAEVLSGLPHALARLGHAVTVILPNYGSRAGNSDSAQPAERAAAVADAVLDFGARQQAVRFIRQPLAERIDAVLVDAPELYQREGLYGDNGGDYVDNAYRFAVLSRGALEYLRLRGERPSVIHAHDWQAGLVPAYQKMLFSDDPIVGGVPAVFTIHNLAFQGLYPASTLTGHRAAVGRLARPCDGVLGTNQLSESRHQFQRASDDGESDIRAGDRYAGIGLRLRRRDCAHGPAAWSAFSTASTRTAGILRPTRSCRGRTALMSLLPRRNPSVRS